jgi:hypothetical protein
MPFMEPQIEHGNWIVVDGPEGSEAIPADLVGNDLEEYHGPLAPLPESLTMFCENRKAWDIKRIEGWGARLSAPGYLDCTPWTVFSSEKEAQDYLDEQAEDD